MKLISLESRKIHITIYKSTDDGGYYWAIESNEINDLFNQRYDTEELAKTAVLKHLFPLDSTWLELRMDDELMTKISSQNN